jgi:hypothetical protein
LDPLEPLDRELVQLGQEPAQPDQLRLEPGEPLGSRARVFERPAEHVEALIDPTRRGQRARELERRLGPLDRIAHRAQRRL